MIGTADKSRKGKGSYRSMSESKKNRLARYFSLDYNEKMHYPKHLLKLIEALKRLPGVGNKSAERFAFQMMDWKGEYLHELSELIRGIPLHVKPCRECGCLVGDEPCRLCSEERALCGVLCVIATPKDALSFEATGEYKGFYHVLGGLLSPLDGKGPDHIPLKKIRERIQMQAIEEVVLALDSTLEGDATALYLRKSLQDLPIRISRLALGLPMGSSLDYVDGGTLARALSGRSTF